MIGDILQPTHLLFILVIALLVLGPKRLPEVGRSLGRGLRDFRSAISGEDDEHSHPPISAPPSADPEVEVPQTSPVPTVATPTSDSSEGTEEMPDDGEQDQTVAAATEHAGQRLN